MNYRDDQRETDAAILKQERLKAARATRTSTTVVAITLLTGIGYCTLEFAARRSPLAIQAVLVLAFLGVALLFMEPRVRFQRANELRILLFYKSPRFYGIVVTAASALILAVTFLLAPAPHVQARAAAPVVRPVVLPPLPEPVKPPEFPALAVSGVILNGKKSSAQVNGLTVHLGERIDDVQIVEVQEDGILVELKGYRRFYSREKIGFKSSSGTLYPRR